jgi:hypothetical protein
MMMEALTRRCDGIDWAYAGNVSPLEPQGNLGKLQHSIAALSTRRKDLDSLTDIIIICFGVDV